jgi:Na+/H+-dicarboxylate symporter
MKWWFRQQLYMQIFICIAIGILLGIFFKDKVHYIKPVGDIFIRLIYMLIVPLTFLTLISGITKLDNIKSLRSIGGFTFLYYALSSLFAAACGMGIALILKPGLNQQLVVAKDHPIQNTDFSFIDNIVQWIPTNPFQSLAETSLLQIIVFALIVGIALLAMDKKAQKLVEIIDQGAEMMIMITEKIMTFAPYGILALMANLVSSLGFGMMKQVGKFVGSQYISLIILIVFFYPLVLKCLAKLSPLRFYRNIAPSMLIASSTTSSSASLPMAMTCAQDNIGAPEKVWGFTLMLGATVNSNGMASVIGVIAVFASYLYGLEITAARMIQFVFLGLALSMGTAGVKNSGPIIAAVLLRSLGIPTEIIIPILISVWPLLDIGDTCLNVAGDLVGTAYTAKKFGMLDEDIYYGRKSAQAKIVTLQTETLNKAGNE